MWLHSENKKYFQAPFLVLQLVTNRDWCQYLEGPISTWKDHNRNISILPDPNIPIVVLPGSDWLAREEVGIKEEEEEEVLSGTDTSALFVTS